MNDPDLATTSPERISRPTMIHEWRNLAFVHWPFDPGRVQSLLPPAIEVDTFEGSAWIGLIPFHLAVHLPPWLPAIPGVSQTKEVNVRTYVRGPDGRRGIWFLSLDAGALPTVVLARMWYRIPYMWARVDYARRGPHVHYHSQRRLPSGREARFDLELTLQSDIVDDLSPLDRFLMCRWRLYSPSGRGVFISQIDHPPWQTVPATLMGIDAGLLNPLGLSAPDDLPVVKFSPGVTVKWGPRRRAETSSAYSGR